MSGLLSIAISVYNGEKYLENVKKAIESVTYDEIELICVVDQRSSDRSVEVYKSECEKNENWKFVVQTGSGRLGEARNLGIENSSGKYIWFLDIDDEFNPRMPEILIDYLEENDADCSFCNYARIVRKEGYVIPSFDDIEYQTHVYTREEAMQKRLEERIPVTAWSYVFKKSLLDDGLRFLQCGVCEDDDFTIKLLSRCNKVFLTEKPLYYYILDLNAGWRTDIPIYKKKGVYDNLETYFKSNMGFCRNLGSFKVRLLLHAAICMERKKYIEFVKSTSFTKEFDEKCIGHSGERFIFVHFPTIYYYMARTYLKIRGEPKQLITT